MDEPKVAVLRHYASPYYDPQKAHEYYMRTRELKGRSTTSLNDEGKKIWSYTKNNIKSEKAAKVKEEQEKRDQKITELREKAEATKEQISSRLKELNEALTQNASDRKKSIDTDKDSDLEEIEKEPFRDLLDAGCGPAPMISLLAEKYPDRHYTGLDLTPAMIEQAKKKNIPNATFVVGDCENFPFEKDSFDAIICSMSFHHYPDPQAFFDSVKRCLRPNGRLILRDVTSDNKVLVWLMNTLEMPLANICGHGDVQVPTRDVVIKCCKKAGLKVEKFEIRKGMRMHCVVRKSMGEGDRQ